MVETCQLMIVFHRNILSPSLGLKMETIVWSGQICTSENCSMQKTEGSEGWEE
jgi:hypothetical protein